MKALEEKYLEGLSELFPSIAAASTEIINLQAIVNLPKGTEHFLTDIHGEYEAFAHVLKNGSGSVKRKHNEQPGQADTGNLDLLSTGEDGADPGRRTEYG